MALPPTTTAAAATAAAKTLFRGAAIAVAKKKKIVVASTAAASAPSSWSSSSGGRGIRAAGGSRRSITTATAASISSRRCRGGGVGCDDLAAGQHRRHRRDGYNNNDDDDDASQRASFSGSSYRSAPPPPPSPPFVRQQHQQRRDFGSGGSGGFSLALLKELRSRSGAPIVDCKKALQHAAGSSEGDQDDDEAVLASASDWLREHGAAKVSSKVDGRETSEGLVGLRISDDDDNNGRSSAAVLVKLASETDFASRSSTCVDLVLNAAQAALLSTCKAAHRTAENLDEETILQAKTEGDKTVKDLLDEAIVSIRENLSFPDAIRIEAGGGDDGGGILVGYVHNRIDNDKDAGTAAAVVELAPDPDRRRSSSSSAAVAVSDDELRDAGKKLAMHVVAARPLYLSPDDVPQDALEREKEILTKQQEGSGKPADIVEKIVLGRLRKYYKDACLTEQGHMIEEKNPTVGKFLKQKGIVVKQFAALTIP